MRPACPLPRPHREVGRCCLILKRLTKLCAAEASEVHLMAMTSTLHGEPCDFRRQLSGRQQMSDNQRLTMLTDVKLCLFKYRCVRRPDGRPRPSLIVQVKATAHTVRILKRNIDYAYEFLSLQLLLGLNDMRNNSSGLARSPTGPRAGSSNASI